jgi:hypothetical protein
MGDRLGAYASLSVRFTFAKCEMIKCVPLQCLFRLFFAGGAVLSYTTGIGWLGWLYDNRAWLLTAHCSREVLNP